jgi:leucyl-tRNA synthetase
MAKSKDNVVDPEYLIEEYGTDTTRLFLLFAAPPERDLEWSDQGVAGCHRFLHRLWNLVNSLLPELSQVAAYAGDGRGLSPDLQEFRRMVHRTIKKVSDDIEDSFHFNTAIAAVMELINAFYLAAENLPRDTAAREVFREAVEAIILLLNPMVPHLAEELWQALGHQTSLQQCCWPEAQAGALEECACTLVVQVNGKVRSRLVAPVTATPAEITDMALADPAIQKWLQGPAPRRVVPVKDKLNRIVLINIVT